MKLTSCDEYKNKKKDPEKKHSFHAVYFLVFLFDIKQFFLKNAFFKFFPGLYFSQKTKNQLEKGKKYLIIFWDGICMGL